MTWTWREVLLTLACSLLAISSIRSVCSNVACYYTPSGSKSSTLPENVKRVTCTESAICSKTYQLLYNGRNTKTITYFWNCISLLGVIMLRNCNGDQIEETGIYPFTSNNALAIGYYYSRSCLCCGDYCNNETMNDKCNEAPIFTKKCYGAQSDLPTLAEDANDIPCTERQSCMKTVWRQDTNSSTENYKWKCLNTPDKTCNFGRVSKPPETGYAIEKSCACCGEMCNNATMMDGITAKKSDDSIGCKVNEAVEEDSTTLTPPPTTETINSEAITTAQLEDVSDNVTSSPPITDATTAVGCKNRADLPYFLTIAAAFIVISL